MPDYAVVGSTESDNTANGATVKTMQVTVAPDATGYLYVPDAIAPYTADYDVVVIEVYMEGPYGAFLYSTTVANTPAGEAVLDPAGGYDGDAGPCKYLTRF